MRLIVTGGGTGGHIYPALSIAQKCLSENSKNQVLYIGKLNGIEEEVCAANKISFLGIDAQYRKNNLTSIFKYIINLFKGIIKSRKAIKNFRPDVVFGTGGYVSFYAMFAAVTMGVPIVLHEANALPGKANLVLSRWAKIVLLNFDCAKDKFNTHKDIRVVGMPVRYSFSNSDMLMSKEELDIPKNKFVVVSFGGSGGASRINDAIMGLLPEISKNDDVYLIHATGKKYFEAFSRVMNERNLQDISNVRILPYLYNMNIYMNCAKLIISRSGASTLAEIQMSKSYAIMIPSPNVADDHQYYNATVAAQKGLGVVLKEDELSDKMLLDLILKIKEECTLKKVDIIDGEYEFNTAVKQLDTDSTQKIMDILFKFEAGE